MLYLLTDQAVVVLGCVGAGVAVRTGAGALEFVTAIDEPITHTEERQIVAGRAPATRPSPPASPPPAQTSPPSRAGPPTAGSPARRVLLRVAGIPLVGRHETIGALDLYWEKSHRVSDKELDAAGLLADMAAGYIANQIVVTNAERTTKQLQHALDSRVVIEQAKGDHHRARRDRSFGRLRAAARPRPVPRPAHP